MSRGEQAKQDILDAAERLISEEGVRVPLRDIALAAGQRNNSAVNYYFRNRQELIDAVVRRRLEPMEQQRRLMLDAVAPDMRSDVDTLLRILILPFLSVDSAYYARFLDASRSHLRADPDQVHGSVWPLLLDELARAVPTSDRDARHRRVSGVATAMFALLAEHERRVHDDASTAGSAEEIIALLAAMVTTPIPASAHAAHMR